MAKGQMLLENISKKRTLHIKNNISKQKNNNDRWTTA